VLTKKRTDENKSSMMPKVDEITDETDFAHTNKEYDAS